MIWRSLVLVLLLTFLPGITFCDTNGGELSEQLDNLENLIFEAEVQTTSCQLHSSWHFPCQLYSYIKLAKKYSNNLRKNKNSKKFQENLQYILFTVDECIEGRKGYWSGNVNDVWVDPVPSVPECALDAFKKLKEELDTQISSLAAISY